MLGCGLYLASARSIQRLAEVASRPLARHDPRYFRLAIFLAATSHSRCPAGLEWWHRAAAGGIFLRATGPAVR